MWLKAACACAEIAKLGYQHATKEDVKYVMTGETGSYLYMAPEVLNGAPYSEKVDVFSLGIVMFELFTMTSLGGLVSSNGGGGPEDDVYARYAQRVAAGHREKLPHTWPQSLQVRSHCTGTQAQVLSAPGSQTQACVVCRTSSPTAGARSRACGRARTTWSAACNACRQTSQVSMRNARVASPIVKRSRDR